MATETGGDHGRRQTVTYLFADLAGSTVLARSLGDAFPALLRLFHETVRETVEAHAGRVERTEGDLLRCEFGDPAQALRAAHDIAMAMAAESWPEGSNPQCRIGIHTGSGLEDADTQRARGVGEAAQAGQVLLSEATARLVEEEARNLGWPLVALGSYGVGDHGETERLVRVDFPDVAAAPSRPRARPRSGSRIPSPPSGIVGRADDLAGAAELLLRDGVRLVTITGPGGTGKTRLSIELARRLESKFPDGAVFVELAGASHPDQLLVAVARSLGIFEGPNRTVIEALATVAGDARLLLVLDNTEQITDAARAVGQVIDTLTAAKVLVTSRSPLRSSWEHEYPLSPLTVPSSSASHDEILASEAVTLLMERASGVRPGFSLTPANEAAIAEITRQLDGLPLAIELAATRLRVLTPEMLLQRLEDRLGMLDKGPADAPERHRTLRAAIQWSHDMLDESERVLFRRLGVFSGGFQLDAASAVCGGDATVDVLATLEDLVAKSLVVFAVEPDGEPRYRLLETLREFALEQLRESGEEPLIRQRHLDWCYRLAGRIENELATPLFPHLLDELERERLNLQAAFSWCLETGTDIEKALVISGRLPLFWDTRGFVNEGLEWSQRLLDAGRPEPSPGRATTYSTVGWLAMLAGDPERSMEALAVADDMWRQLGDRAGLSRSLAMRGMSTYNVGLLDEAEGQFDEAVSIARQYPEMEWIAEAWCPYGTAHIALARGDLPTTLQMLNQVLDYSKTRGLTWGVGHAQLSLGVLALMGGDLGQAAQRLSESLAVRTELRDARGICDCLGIMAVLASSAGEPRLTAVLLGAAEMRREASGHRPVPWQQPLLEGASESAARALGDGFPEAFAEGRAMPPDEAVRFAVERVGALTAAATH